MTERKGTPDILDAILSGSTPPDQSSAPQAAPAPPVTRAERAPRASSNKQTQWEYLVVSFHEQNGWHARFINGHELDNWPRGPQLHGMLDQLGEDGGELINVVKSEPLYGTMDRLQAFFKRMK